MPYVKCNEWPKVLVNDHGIRPVGQPDTCLYCQKVVGQEHGRDCVCVSSLVRYNVMVEDKLVGTYDLYEPHHWDEDMQFFIRNENTWCANNAVNDIVWTDKEAEKLVKAIEKPDCACSLLRFEPSEVLDEGPFIYIEESGVENALRSAAESGNPE